MKTPSKAKDLLDFIGSIEAPKGYGTIYGNNQRKLPVPLTSMTFDEVQKAQRSWTKRFGSSACGRYQFMRATLKDLKTKMNIKGSTKFSAVLQDEMGYYLLKRRGYTKYMSGVMTRTLFGKKLAQEWASFPVLKDCKGAHQRVKRGQSYYAGDALNKSLVSPVRIEQVLDKMLSKHTPKYKDQPKRKVVRENQILRLIKWIISLFTKRT